MASLNLLLAVIGADDYGGRERRADVSGTLIVPHHAATCQPKEKDVDPRRSAASAGRMSPMQPRCLARFSRICLVSCLVLCLCFAGCATPEIPTAAWGIPEITDEASARAEQLLEQGRAVEPDLTAWLMAGADRMNLSLYGLSNRMKSKASLERKIQTAMQEEAVPAEAVIVDDVLRYTVVVVDDPVGIYNRVAADILKQAQNHGYAVLEVKNYWPAGDDYSGINCILDTPAGFRWELQIHTISSLAARNEGHPLYERYRLPSTTRRERRRLFDIMADRWNWVRIPDHVLIPHSVHPKEEIILRPRP